MPDIELFVQSLANGVSVGAIYGLIALGFVLVYKSTEVVNFALGDLLMFSAFAGWSLSVALGWPIWLAVLAAIFLTSLLSGIINEAVVSRIIGQPQFAHILLTLGIAFTLRGLILLIWGADQRSLDSLAPDTLLEVAGITLRAERVQIILITLVLVIALQFFFRKTRFGLALQALGENQMAAYLMAIPVRRAISGIWMLSGAIAAIAGLMLAPLLLVDTNLWLVMVKGLIVAVMGSFHSVPGALGAGILVGVIEQLAGVYLDAEYRDLVVYASFFAILAVFPKGLFGGQSAKKV
ncbi:High-affinity branched-chain amino acid transport system permease protein LivH [Pseudovibrio axinellae]|uniref:High-affinity branched-chain amino acid transport system permease protein LivH n=1 Tax=Pseudovibrio axinellae TaxID=989403 RepID=A0A165ZGD9_9HYPH|nr:branched-chain amino acid ABC transporter permease [Pseudovibrio axinellae]KZL19868.1 High-affinity branched-chain amino acid transport system permease protein LivH [Pseudovibrio axinellae]SER38697.1 amino acid/amide ABC transporter membrane protein 1, HAAT family [Pseudovibrio axinellae]